MSRIATSRSGVVLTVFALAGWACAASEVDPHPAGAAGTNGAAGDVGTAGTAGGGNPGAAGTFASAGTNGSAGTIGGAGTTGTTGAAGTTASAGSNGRGGTTASAGTSGAAGTAGGRAGSAGVAGRGGTTGVAGTNAAAGRGGTSGAAGRGGTTGSGGTTGAGGGASSNLCAWPTAMGSQSVSSTISVTGMYDGGMKRFIGAGALGGSGQNEGQGALFEIQNGGTLQNVIIGSPAADGVHCRGSCTIRNVWWEDVGEDAATLQGSSSSQMMTIENSGAKGATDKILQHNGPGTMIVRNFCAQDFGKLYRSCGNCSSQYTRHVQFDNVLVIPRAGPLAGVNANYNDSATFARITIRAAANSVTICERYNGNDTGAEPSRVGSGANGTNCIYSASDITWQP
jgi:hypothetical protein